MGKDNYRVKRINTSFIGKDILSIDQFSRSSLEKLFTLTEKISSPKNKNRVSILLRGKIVALLFFEPSTRTFTSFAVATKRLGGQTLEFQNFLQTSSVVKGESLADTIKVMENYCDLIIMRHPEIGSSHQAAAAAFFLPIINAGDGAGEHPTQAMLDIYTIYERFGRIDGIRGLICADLRYGRGVHSLIKAFSLFKNVTLYLLAPAEIKLSQEQYNECQKGGVRLIEIHNEQDIPPDCQFWYWTRLQKERYEDNTHKNIGMFRLTSELLKSKGNKDMIILHILPRIDEVAISVDSDPRSLYFTKQVKNGMYIRMALLALVLGKKL